MSQQSRAWDEWLDRLVDGQKPTVDDFARSALIDLPRTTIQIRPLNYRCWGFKSAAEMEAAFGESE